jgi:hypothetical protein
MSYEGEVIGHVEGIEVRQLTAEERTRRGEQRYCVVGYSHWNPASFFADHAVQLEHQASILRAAGALIQSDPTPGDRPSVPALSPAETRIADLEDALRVARTEIDRWGFGDFRFGNTPRDPKTLAALALIDKVVPQ